MQKICMMEEVCLREEIVERSCGISHTLEDVLPIQAQEIVGHHIRESTTEDVTIIEPEVSWKPEQSPALKMTELKQSKREAHFERKERKVVTSSVDQRDEKPTEDVVAPISEISVERREIMQNENYAIKDVSPQKKHVTTGTEVTILRKKDELAYSQESVHEIKRSQTEPPQISAEMTTIVKAIEIATKLEEVHEKGKSCNLQLMPWNMAIFS